MNINSPLNKKPTISENNTTDTSKKAPSLSGKSKSTYKHCNTLPISPKNLHLTTYTQSDLHTHQNSNQNRVNPLCDNYYKCLCKKKMKGHYNDFIDLVSNKMSNANQSLKNYSDAFRLCMEDNMKRMNERDEIIKQRELYKQQIELEKEEIMKLKDRIAKAKKSKIDKENEFMQLKEQISKINELVNELQTKIDLQIKENKELKKQSKYYKKQCKHYKELIRQLEEAKKQMKPRPDKFDLFVKDVAKLISTK